MCPLAPSCAALRSPEIGSLTPLRLVRLLRPLRTIKGFAGLRTASASLFGSVPLLGAAALVGAWLVLIFSIISVELFGGRLGARCVFCDDQDCVMFPKAPVISADLPCDVSEAVISLRKRLRMQQLPQNMRGWDESRCKAGQICMDLHRNPNEGATSYDNVGDAMLNVLQAATWRGWGEQMSMTSRGAGRIRSVPYFIFLVFTLYILVCLPSVVMAQIYERQMHFEVSPSPCN